MSLILYISEKKIDAFLFSRGRLSEHRVLCCHEVVDFVQSCSKSTQVSLVLDTVEEGIQVDYVPSLLPWEKPSLQKRLFEKNKQKGAYAQRFIWSGLKKTTADQRSETLLITHSITPTECLANLVSAIEGAQLVWGGFFSAAYLIKGYFFKQIKSAEGLSVAQLKQPVLLFANMSSDHYRQCFFYEGYLQLTRLIPFEQNAANPDQHRRFLVHEARLASRFIYNQGLLDRKNPISYVIIDSLGEQAKADLKAQFLKENLLSVSQTSTEAFFVTHAIPVQDENVHFANVVVKEVNKSWVPSFYRVPYVQMTNGFRLGRLLVSLLAGVALMTLLMMITHGGLQHYFLGQKAELLAKTETVLKTQREGLLLQARGRESVVDMEAIVKFSVMLNRLNATEAYGINLDLFSLLLAAHPGVKIDSVNWQPINQLDDLTMQVSIRGQVHPFEGQFKPMNQLLDAFSKDLQAQPGVTQVVITQQPFSLEQARNVRFGQTQQQDSLPFAMTWRQARNAPPKTTQSDLP
ncbi:hypothetical protein [Thiomicrospira microaerophila]|uniref:hypothetical protein n=1 Tax=Thiomicrospira microaerophila TaxID=406020 RepID=UPI0005CA57CE|nr:hypothetical protein [Thiomicrospira microaerophila]